MEGKRVGERVGTRGLWQEGWFLFYMIWEAPEGH